MAPVREEEKAGEERPVRGEAPAREELPAAPAAPEKGEKAPPAGEKPRKKPAPGKKAPGKKAPPPPKKGKKAGKPSPVPASMWLLPSFRLPFSTPGEFARWFLRGINFWAVAAVALCALGGWLLVEWLSQPVYREAAAALAGGEATAGLRYTVEMTGERAVTVTGNWDAGKGEEAPGPELAAAVCAALSPQEIYGHSSHLYWSIAREFFDGEAYDLTVELLEDTPQEKDEEPWEPVFSATLPAGEDQWPEPDCPDPDFAAAFEEAYSQYWLFGQGRKEVMDTPQSDPIIEEGDRPEEESSEEEAPPLPDLTDPEGESAPEDGPGGEEDPGEEAPDEEEPGEDEAPRPPEDPGLLDRILEWAAGCRGLTWEEALDKFLHR